MTSPAAAPATIGWREWLALPEFGIAAIRAKIDTGARTSALHVSRLEEFSQGGVTWLRFRVASGRRKAPVFTDCECPALDRRAVSDSSGNSRERWFIRASVMLAGQRWPIEINLTDRGGMLFPMLLGRHAVRERFCIDPARSFVAGRLRQPV